MATRPLSAIRSTRLLALVGAATVILSACSGSGTGSSAPNQRTGPTFESGYQSPTYSNKAHWLCRPDIPAPQNLCVGDLSVTTVSPDGKLTVRHATSAQHAPVDCFYVYPTVDQGRGTNEDIDAPHPTEIEAARQQAAPFGRVCNVFAPLYRESTLRTLFSASSEASSALAYGDVKDAFRYYLGHFNQGHPFILLGHSQGSGLLVRLMSEMIDPNPSLRGQMVSAVVPGITVELALTGEARGTFANIPACRVATEINCVIGYSSYRSTAPPPPDALFGRSAGPGSEDICTNPASLGGGAAPLLTMFAIDPNSAHPPSLVWAPYTTSPPRITTRYVALPQLVIGQCVNNGQFSYLMITVTPTPGPRAQNIAGDLTPPWGLHVVDVNVAQGNLIATVQQQVAAWQRANRSG